MININNQYIVLNKITTITVEEKYNKIIIGFGDMARYYIFDSEEKMRKTLNTLLYKMEAMLNV